MRFDRYWANSEISLVEPHRTKIGQNAPSCTGQFAGGQNESSVQVYSHSWDTQALYVESDLKKIQILEQGPSQYYFLWPIC